MLGRERVDLAMPVAGNVHAAGRRVEPGERLRDVERRLPSPPAWLSIGVGATVRRMIARPDAGRGRAP